MNGEPGAFAELPGVVGLDGPHVLVGPALWPVVGFWVGVPGFWLAHAAAGVAIAKPMEHTAASTYFRICPFLLGGRITELDLREARGRATVPATFTECECRRFTWQPRELYAEARAGGGGLKISGPTRAKWEWVEPR